MRSQLKNEVFQKVALLGNQYKNQKALYLQENNTPLVLVGKTKISGNVRLPKRGVKTGNIAGTSYYGSRLIYGDSQTDAGKLPKIKNLQHLRDFYENYRKEGSEFIELDEETNIYQPFTEKTLLYESEGAIDIREVTLEGNIILASGTSIRIQASAHLENVIVIAPKVSIEADVKGCFQVIAKKQIRVKENVSLLYPSSLVVLQDFEEEKTNTNREIQGIQIDKNSDVKGVVFFHSKYTKNSYKTQVLIDNEANVTGEVYCNKNLELKGRVDGYIYANNFIANQFGGIYVNHIYNGVIDGTSISETYCGLFAEEGDLKVAKWLE